MKAGAEQVLCRFHLTNLIRHGAEPLYEWILAAALRERLHGATVLEDFLGLGNGGTLLNEGRWRLTKHLPYIVEVIDGPRPVERLLARVEPVFPQGTITLTRAHVALYRPAASTSGPHHATPPSAVSAVGETSAAVATRDAGTAWEIKTMKAAEPGVLMRVFIGESAEDRERPAPLYRSILEHARDAGLASAIVLKSPMGFGQHARLHTTDLIDAAADLPVVVELLDTAARIAAFAPLLDRLMSAGMVTLENVQMLRYGAPHERAPA